MWQRYVSKIQIVLIRKSGYGYSVYPLSVHMWNSWCFDDNGGHIKYTQLDFITEINCILFICDNSFNKYASVL